MELNTAIFVRNSKWKYLWHLSVSVFTFPICFFPFRTGCMSTYTYVPFKPAVAWALSVTFKVKSRLIEYRIIQDGKYKAMDIWQVYDSWKNCKIWLYYHFTTSCYWNCLGFFSLHGTIYLISWSILSTHGGCCLVR